MIVADKASVGLFVAKKTFGRYVPDEAIGLVRRGEIVAGVVYESYNGRSIVCHIAVAARMTPAYLAAIFHYPFIHCGVEKIICPVSSDNAECIGFVQNLGFKEEARILAAAPDGDMLLYTMTAEECRFIGGRYMSRLKLH